MTATRAYVLVLRLASPRRLPVGALGTLPLPAASYAFAGQTTGALEKRLARHRARGEGVRTHVDALAEVAEVVDAVAAGSDACRAADRLAALPGAIPIVGFGATACDCLTHLYAFADRGPEALVGAVGAGSLR